MTPIDEGASAVEPTVLGERYELQERLDAGGMGEVWLARDTLLGRAVAIKILDRQFAQDPRLVDQFRREAQSAAVLNHPNIVAVYDWGAVEGTYYLVMEYVPGSNLKELIRRRGALPEATALRLIDQIAAALELAHQHGIVHCDVKPQNVLLDAQGHPKVTDFGIACALGLEAFGEGHVLGSAHYISPERATGRPSETRSDLYSLGVVLFELLTGRVPFGGEAVETVARRHVQEAAPSPRSIEPAISPTTEALTLRLLAKDPPDRYADASDLRVAIGEAQQALLSSLELTQPLRAFRTASLPIVRPSPPRRSFVASSLASARRMSGLAPWAIGAGTILAFLLVATVARPFTGSRPTAVAGIAATPSAQPASPTAVPAAGLVSALRGTPSPGPCQFVMGFKQLRDKLGPAAGDCVENEHPDAQSGDTVQKTTRGMFVWRKSDQVTTYTDGQRTWIDGPYGVQQRGNNERFKWELQGR